MENRPPRELPGRAVLTFLAAGRDAVKEGWISYRIWAGARRRTGGTLMAGSLQGRTVFTAVMTAFAFVV